MHMMCILVLVTRCSYLMSTSRISFPFPSSIQTLINLRECCSYLLVHMMCISFVQRSHISCLPLLKYRHFFYIHFLVLLSALYLPLFAIDTAYAAGWGEETYIGLDVLNGVIVFLQCIFVVGLRSLGTKMIVSSLSLCAYVFISHVPFQNLLNSYL